MNSDFSAARLHLDRAYHYLRGADETSQKACEALALLIEAITVEEFRQPRRTATLLKFRPRDDPESTVIHGASRRTPIC